MSRRMAAWLNPEQIPLIQQVAEAAGLSLVAAGSPARGQSAGVAGALNAAAMDDLRGMLLNVDAEVLLIASAGALGSGAGADDEEALEAASKRGLRVATLEPVPASALDLSGGGRRAGVMELARMVPLMRASPAMRRAADVLESFGHVRLVSLCAWSRGHVTSLGAQIYSAMDAVLWLMGEPECVDAAYIAPTQGTGVHMLPGETLRDLHGELSANLRFADGRAASLVLSDQAGRWNRELTLVGAAGRLRLLDDRLEWLGPTGETVDESHFATDPATSPKDHGLGALVDALGRLLDGASEAPSDRAAVLAMGQAALLSARTGQAESPATIRRMAAV